MKEISPWRIQRLDAPKDPEPEYVYTSAVDQETHLRDYWKIVVKRRRLLALVFLVVLGIGSYFTLTASTLYTATSILRIDPPNAPSITGLVEVWNISELASEYYGTQLTLLKGRRLAAKVIADLKLDSNDDFTKFSIVSSNIMTRVLGNLQYAVSLIGSLATVSPKATEKQKSTTQTVKAEPDADQQLLDVKTSGWVGRYLALLDVNPVKGTRLVEVEFTTPDPALSQLLANGHARGFIGLNMETRQELTQAARQFLDAKNVELKRAVETSEEKLNRFRQTHGVVSMEKGENVVVDRLVELNKKLTEARAQRLEAESLKKTIENKPVQYLSQVVTQGQIPSLRANLQNLEAERVRLSSTFKPDHPRMLELSKQINETRRSINAEIGYVVKGIEENYAAARAREQTVQAEAEKQQRLALNMKELGVEYAVLEEEVKVNRSLYETVLNRLHATSVSNDLVISNMQVLQLAERSDSPSFPKTVRDLGIFGLLGLFLGLGSIFFLEYLDSTVSTPEHVWRAVALSTFGVVPNFNSLKPLVPYNRPPGAGQLSQFTSRLLPSRSNLPSGLIVDHHPLSAVPESYRTIRTALLFSQAEKPPQVILLTSASPNEGKTLTTLNLAITLAQDSYKVLIIDADLRKGTCHTRFRLTNHKGISNILTGQMALQDGIQATSVSGLSILSRGHCPPNPSELLGSKKMKQVLAGLRESFDFILIDSPPVIAVSDAAVLATNADGVILVIHAHKTTQASARRAVECLETVRAPILGTILTGINLDNPDYSYYRHYYGSNYGDITTDDNGSSDGKNNGGIVQSELREAKLSPIEPVAGMVSREFFDKVVAELSEAMGPMASRIVIERVALLGESLDSFPTSRLKELIKKVCEEILDEKLSENFQDAMALEIIRSP